MSYQKNINDLIFVIILLMMIKRTARWESGKKEIFFLKNNEIIKLQQ